MRGISIAIDREEWKRRKRLVGGWMEASSLSACPGAALSLPLNLCRTYLVEARTRSVPSGRPPPLPSQRLWMTTLNDDIYEPRPGNCLMNLHVQLDVRTQG